MYLKSPHLSPFILTAHIVLRIKISQLLQVLPKGRDFSPHTKAIHQCPNAENTAILSS